MKRFRAEWEPQGAVLVAWPHVATDWCDTIEQVQACYVEIARAIMADEHLIVVTPEPDVPRAQLAGAPEQRLTIVDLPTNDTWTRDYGPLAVDTASGARLLDFTFNAWGMKFAANLDNMVSQRLFGGSAMGYSLDDHRDMVLEGGSVETDGRGTILTTARCLLSPNRNPTWDRTRIEAELCSRLGAQRVLWLCHGHVPGDDTDCHIDTMARFMPGGVIVCASAAPGSEEADDIEQMHNELEMFSDADGNPYRVVKLPPAPIIVGDDGHRLPATYANFLITNHSILVPTYGNPATDEQALAIVGTLAGDRRVVGIDCRALIEQHGSLHCATMQLPPTECKQQW